MFTYSSVITCLKFCCTEREHFEEGDNSVDRVHYAAERRATAVNGRAAQTEQE